MKSKAEKFRDGAPSDKDERQGGASQTSTRGADHMARVTVEQREARDDATIEMLHGSANQAMAKQMMHIFGGNVNDVQQGQPTPTPENQPSATERRPTTQQHQQQTLSTLDGIPTGSSFKQPTTPVVTDANDFSRPGSSGQMFSAINSGYSQSTSQQQNDGGFTQQNPANGSPSVHPSNMVQPTRNTPHPQPRSMEDDSLYQPPPPKRAHLQQPYATATPTTTGRANDYSSHLQQQLNNANDSYSRNGGFEEFRSQPLRQQLLPGWHSDDCDAFQIISSDQVNYLPSTQSAPVWTHPVFQRRLEANEIAQRMSEIGEPMSRKTFEFISCYFILRILTIVNFYVLISTGTAFHPVAAAVQAAFQFEDLKKHIDVKFKKLETKMTTVGEGRTGTKRGQRPTQHSTASDDSNGDEQPTWQTLLRDLPFRLPIRTKHELINAQNVLGGSDGDNAAKLIKKFLHEIVKVNIIRVSCFSTLPCCSLNLIGFSSVLQMNISNDKVLKSPNSIVHYISSACLDRYGFVAQLSREDKVRCMYIDAILSVSKQSRYFMGRRAARRDVRVKN